MSQLIDLPLFPLGVVLYPGGQLPLRIFEQRYMDMAKVCLKDDAPFGVCLIANGRDTGAPAIPHDVGTLARIKTWDMPQLGVLLVQCKGEQRFRITSRRTEPSGLQRAEIELIDDEALAEAGVEQKFLAALLKRVIEHIKDPVPLQPYRFDDAAWVAYRLAEMLPMSLPIKQKILALNDVSARLGVVQQFLQQQGLLNTSN